MHSDFFRTKQLNWVRGTGAGTPPSNLYMALYSAAPARDGTGGTDVTSIVASSRLTFPANDWSSISTSGSSRVISNASDRTFGNALAVRTITHLVLFDASSGGNCYDIFELPSPIATVVGQPINIDANTYTLAFETLAVSNYYANIWLNYIKGTSAPTPPTTVYAGLWNGDPLATGAGGTENTSSFVSGGRASKATSDFSSVLTDGTDLYIQNGTNYAFGNAIAAVSCTHVAIMDAATSGNQLWRFSKAFTSTNGAPFSIPVTSLVLRAI